MRTLLAQEQNNPFQHRQQCFTKVKPFENEHERLYSLQEEENNFNNSMI